MTIPPLPPFTRNVTESDVTLTSDEQVRELEFSFRDFTFRDTRRLLFPPVSRQRLLRMGKRSPLSIVDS